MRLLSMLLPALDPGCRERQMLKGGERPALLGAAACEEACARDWREGHTALP